MAFLLGETRDVRELVRKESEAARAELEKRAAELSEETKQETDRIKEIFKASIISAGPWQLFSRAKGSR